MTVVAGSAVVLAILAVGLLAALPRNEGTPLPTTRDRIDRLLGNTDDDRPVTIPPRARDTEFREFVDAWGNPLACSGPDDLGRPIARARIVLADGRVVDARPRIDPATGEAFHRGRFRLLSAGADGVFGSEDDVGN